MPNSFREIGRKTESLIEQGKEADKKVQNCQAQVTASANRVAAAKRQFDAASEMDEEGNPTGDVRMAAAQLNMAENQLAASQRALAAARQEADSVRQRKNNHIREIEKHNKVERSNLEKLRGLRTGPFSADSAALTEGIAQRLNEAEDARVKLLRSMGIETAPDYVNVGNEGSADGGWAGLDFSYIDTYEETQRYQGGQDAAGLTEKQISLPSGSDLRNLLDRIFNGNDSDSSENDEPNDEIPAPKNGYTSLNDLSDEVWKYADDYVQYPEKYNGVLRADQTTKDTERFRKIINAHQVENDMVVYRTASLADLGAKFADMSPEDMVGQCYQFSGIMSVANNYAFAGQVNDGNDATFEIRVPAGTPGLDLLNVPTFYQAMFDSPFCYIESATKKENSMSTHFVVRILSAGEGLNRVNDYSSLQKYVGAKYGMLLDSSMRNLNIDSVKSSIAGFETVVREFPEEKVHLRSGRATTEGIMSYTPNSLSFNQDLYSDDIELQNECRFNSRIGYLINNVSPVSVGVHEAAHMVEWVLIQNNPQIRTEKQKTDAWNNCTEAKSIVKKACENIKKTEYGSGKSDTDLINSISGYASENCSDTMAEAFADVYANGERANPLSKEIKRLTHEVLNSYKRRNMIC